MKAPEASQQGEQKSSVSRYGGGGGAWRTEGREGRGELEMCGQIHCKLEKGGGETEVRGKEGRTQRRKQV